MKQSNPGGNQTTIDWKGAGIPEFDLSLIPDCRVEQDVIDRYQEDGVVLMRGLYRDWVEPLREGLQKNLDSPLNYAFPCERYTGW